MLPLGDVVPRRTFPRVTVVVAVGLLVGTGWYQLALSADQQLECLWRLGATGATVPWPALLSAGWFDPSWLGGLANVATLTLFGPAVEDRFGRARFAALLVVAQVAGVLAAVWSARPLSAPLAGATVVVSAVLASYVALFPKSKLSFWLPTSAGGALRECQALWAVLVWVLCVPGGLLRQLEGGVVPASHVLASLIVGAVASLSARAVARRDRMSVAWWDSPGD